MMVQAMVEMAHRKSQPPSGIWQGWNKEQYILLDVPASMKSSQSAERLVQQDLATIAKLAKSTCKLALILGTVCGSLILNIQA
jgi:hypothetical protein